jgi:hypothetical protein
MLAGMAGIAQSTLGDPRWESLLESTLEFLGLRPLGAIQAQALVPRLKQELSAFIEACGEQMKTLGGMGWLRNRRIRANPMFVATSLAKLDAMTDRLDAILREYERLQHPGRAASSTPPSAAIPPSGPPLTLSQVTGRQADTLAREMRGVYWHAMQMAQHAQRSIGGTRANPSPYAVTNAVAGTHILVQWLRQRSEAIRRQMP